MPSLNATHAIKTHASTPASGLVEKLFSDTAPARGVAIHIDTRTAVMLVIALELAWCVLRHI
jgi:hypothetical protein